MNDDSNLWSRVAAAVLLLGVSPVLVACGLAMLCMDGPPVLFRQRRVGKGGKQFELLKLRSMTPEARGTRITTGGDRRVTPLGQILRRYKLDEFPQLWNILRGDMSFIGPRPEVPEYVDLSDPRWQFILSVRPGLTDIASLMCRHEEALLAERENVETFYRNSLLPWKLDMSAYCIRHRSFGFDLKLLLLTIKHSFLPVKLRPSEIAAQFAYIYRGQP